MRTQPRTKLLGGGGGGRGRGNGRNRPWAPAAPQRAYPRRGLNGLGDYVTETALGYVPGTPDLVIGAAVLAVIGAAFVVPALTKKR